MSAAISGLIGVIVGVLLGAFVSVAVELYKRRTVAQAAGEGIEQELELVLIKISSGLADNPQGDRRWAGELPHRVFDDRISDIAYELSKDARTKLFTAYGLIASMNLPDSPLAGIRDNRDLIDGAGKILDADLKRLRRRRVWGGKVPLFSGAVALIVGLIVLSIVPFSDINSGTVASRVQSAYGGRSLVTCDTAGSGWSCDVFEPSTPVHKCVSATRPVAIRDPTTDVVVSVSRTVGQLGARSRDCDEIAETSDSVIQQGNHLEIIPTETPAEREQRILRDKLRVVPTPPKKNFWQR